MLVSKPWRNSPSVAKTRNSSSSSMSCWWNDGVVMTGSDLKLWERVNSCMNESHSVMRLIMVEMQVSAYLFSCKVLLPVPEKMTKYLDGIVLSQTRNRY